MQAMYDLCILFDNGKEIRKEILLHDTLENIDAFILNKKYNSSEDIRNDRKFKPIIDNFINNMDVYNKHKRGDIVITKSNSFDRIAIMYKPKIDLAKNFVKLMSEKMKLALDNKNPERIKDREYAKEFIKIYRYTLFTENERIGLFTGLKYRYKTLYNDTLSKWKQKYTKSTPKQIENLRTLTKVLGKDMRYRIEYLLEINNNKMKKAILEIKDDKLDRIQMNEDIDIDSMDEFDQQNYFHPDERLNVVHLDKTGEVRIQKYSEYLEEIEKKEIFSKEEKELIYK